MNSNLKFVPPGMLARLSPDMLHQQSSALNSINTESILLPTIYINRNQNLPLPDSEEVTKNINSKNDIAGEYMISNSSRNIEIIA